MKATLFDRRHRREALTGGDQPWPWCVPPPGGGSVWPCSRCVDTSGQMRGQRGPRLRIPDWKRLVAGTLSYPQTETGPYQILVMSYVRTQPMRAAGSKRTDSGIVGAGGFDAVGRCSGSEGRRCNWVVSSET